MRILAYDAVSSVVEDYVTVSAVYDLYHQAKQRLWCLLTYRPSALYQVLASYYHTVSAFGIAASHKLKHRQLCALVPAMFSLLKWCAETHGNEIYVNVKLNELEGRGVRGQTLLCLTGTAANAS